MLSCLTNGICSSLFFYLNILFYLLHRHYVLRQQKYMLFQNSSNDRHFNISLTLFTKETVFHSCINIIFWVQEFPFNFNSNVNVHNNGSKCTRVLVRISISSIGLILKARRQSGAHPITSVLGTERINEYTSMDHITGPIVV